MLYNAVTSYFGVKQVLLSFMATKIHMVQLEDDLVRLKINSDLLCYTPMFC